MKITSIAEKPAFRTKIKSTNVNLQEMLIGYFLAPFCAMISNSIFAAYLNRYYVDVLGWTKFGAFSALLPIISVIFVVAGNILMGAWIDKTRTSQGKARPYLLVVIPLLAVGIILLFLTPTKSSSLTQMVWIALSYNLYYALAYPCYYTAHNSLVSLSTRNGNQRGILATLSNASTVAAAGLGGAIIVPILLQSYMFVMGANGLDAEASYAHWRTLAIVLAFVTAFGVLLEYYFTRERITEEALKLNITEKKIPTSQHIKACTSDKYWWMVILFVAVFQMGQAFKNGTMSFYVRWMFDSVIKSANPEQTSGALMSTLGLVGGLPSVVGMVAAWPLANKFGKKNSIVAGLVLAFAGGLAAFINVNSFPIVCVGVVLKSFGIIPAQYVLLAMISDVLDHLEAKNGFRSDGFTMSMYSAVFVGLPGIVNGVLNGLLTGSGYSNVGIAADASTMAPIAADKLASFTGQVAYTQSGSTQWVLALMYLGMDMITFVICFFLLFRMNVEKHLDEDHALITGHQKEAVLAEGGTWVDPAERARLEQEESDRKAEEERIADLKKLCQEKGLDFEKENQKYLDKKEKQKNSLIGKFLGM